MCSQLKPVPALRRQPKKEESEEESEDEQEERQVPSKSAKSKVCYSVNKIKRLLNFGIFLTLHRDYRVYSGCFVFTE